MALNFDHGAIQWLAADAATTVYTVSGLSFQPKALRFYWVGLQSASDAVSEAVNSCRGVGFAVDTSNRRCVGSFSQDTAGTSNCGTVARNDAVCCTTDGAGGSDGELDLNSITSDGFTLIVDDAAPQNITVFWEAWGGDEITVAVVGDIAEPAASGDVDYTVTGFTNGATDQVVMFAGVQSTQAVNTADAEASGLVVGFAAGTAAGDNVFCGGSADDASASMDTDGWCGSGAVLGMCQLAGAATLSAWATLTAFGTNNFRLNWANVATANRRNIFLAIKGGNWKTGELTINGNTGSATATVSGLSWAPIGLSLIGRMTTEQTLGNTSANDRMGLGTGTSTTSRRSMGMLDEDATASSACEINTTIQYDQVLCFPSTAGGLQSAYDINAMNSDGFQLIVDTAGGVASEWIGYLTFAAVSNAIAKSGSDSLATVISESSQVRLPSSSGESMALGLTEDRSQFVRQNRDESIALGLSELGKSMALNVSGGDSMAVGLTEVSAVRLRYNVTDDLLMTFTELGKAAFYIVGSDSLAYRVSEDRVQFNRILRDDTNDEPMLDEAGVPIDQESGSEFLFDEESSRYIKVNPSEDRQALAIMLRDDSLFIGLTELGKAVFAIAGSDSLKIGLTEDRTQFVRQTRDDLDIEYTLDELGNKIEEEVVGTEYIWDDVSSLYTAVHLTEVGSAKALFSRDDSLKIGLAEVSAVLYRFASGESIAVIITENSTAAIAIPTGDSLKFGLTEDRTMFVRQNRDDEDENYTLGEDGLKIEAEVGPPEYLLEEQSGLYLAVHLIEDSTVRAMLSRNDDLLVGTIEDRTLKAMLNRDELLPYNLTELSTLAVALSTSDTVATVISELSSLLQRVSTTDTIVIGLTEDRSVFVRLTRDESLALNVTDDRFVTAYINRDDAPSIVIVDASSLNVFQALNTSDSVSVGMLDAYLNLKAMLLRDDTGIEYTLDEGSGAPIDEESGGGFIEDEGSNQFIKMGLSEDDSQFARITRDDSLALNLQETARLLIPLVSGGDSLKIGMTEAGTVAVAISSAGDSLKLSLTETSQPFVYVAGIDAVSTVLMESSSLFQSVSVQDGVAIGLAEAVQSLIQLLSSTDQTAVVIVDAGVVMPSINVSDGVVLQFVEDRTIVQISVATLENVLIATVRRLGAQDLSVRVLERTVKFLGVLNRTAMVL